MATYSEQWKHFCIRQRITTELTNSAETPAFGVGVFDTYGISTANLLLTLRDCGLNKRIHFMKSLMETSPVDE